MQQFVTVSLGEGQCKGKVHIRREENQLDVTECFVALMIGSTCFGHFHAHHREARDYMCVVTAYGVQCFVTGCRGSGAGQQTLSPGRGMLHHPSSWTDSL